MGLSGFHIFALLIILLVFFGPSRLPGLGKGVGEAIRGFKKGLEGDEIDVTDTAKREKLSASEDEHVADAQKTKKRTDA
ncbi:MAG TPA: twin-arginine translocase TatA/TatE family subunit [Bdellovibrionales bacterium]|nr:twin-arginine translocase TatA/TatE family subunit [Bdellovibrionales bacterium]